MPLLVFEGIDGCGKTTQQQRLIRRLRDQDLHVVTWREPGGTALGEELRRLLLDPGTEACPLAEVFGYQLARAQLVQEKIAPALAGGAWVVLDRFHYSSIAYQAYGLGLPERDVAALSRIALQGLRVDKCFWLRLDPQRAARRRSGGADRIEARGEAYLQKVHEGYLAQSAGSEFVTIDAEQDVETVHEQVWAAIGPLLRRITSH